MKRAVSLASLKRSADKVHAANERVRRAADSLPVEKIIREFEESEAKPGHRKDAFKIDVPFDEALRRIGKAGPGRRVPSKKSRP